MTSGLVFNYWSCVDSPSEVFTETLIIGDYSQCLVEMEAVPVSSLWPKNSTLRALASLLTADHPQVNKAAAEYLCSGASHSHFRTRVSTVTCRLYCCGYTHYTWNLLVSVIQSSLKHCHWQLCVMCDCVCVCVFQAVEFYTQALSEAGGQSQRAACSALSCLQVSGFTFTVCISLNVQYEIWRHPFLV